MAARPGPLWLVGLALCALSGGGPGPRAPAGCPARRLGPRERRDMQREILAVLGLPGRPRPRAPSAAARLPASAPLFMLDLYHAMARDDDEDGGPPERRPGRADLVMSFVNMVERDRTLGHQEPHWKEFRFDLTQIPEGEMVTAAEFRIYKMASTHLLNGTLHISMFEVVREQSNRESDLFFLDLQTLRAGDEGWLVLDVTAASDRWLLSRNKDLGLRLYVETDDGHSVDPGLAGLLGQRAPGSKQPFLVTFFRASPGPVRAPRAARPLKRRPPKKTNELPHPNKLPGIFGEVREGPGAGPRSHLEGTEPSGSSVGSGWGSPSSTVLWTSLCPLRPCHPEVLSLPSPGSQGFFQKSPSESGAPSSGQHSPWGPCRMHNCLCGGLPRRLSPSGSGVGLPCPPALLSSTGSSPFGLREPLDPVEWGRQERWDEVTTEKEPLMAQGPLGCLLKHREGPQVGTQGRLG
ncbi:bone morphogenetic protein 8a- [Lynx pardinus]|uniref:Bone morphogenetic protein 8a n=1 Tax=Lynx pardinus TaxID=191816 RepID=A0A485N430_LYNPA|nr:bone morphogenetic protein 8a- [Lynx pardinus]